MHHLDAERPQYEFVHFECKQGKKRRTNSKEIQPNQGIARQMKATRKVESLTKTKIEIPGGFTYGAFNGAGHVKPWSILRMVEATRAVNTLPSQDGISFLDLNRLYKNYFIFILASTTQVEKNFYNTDLLKAPVHIDVELEHVGKSSYLLKSSAFLCDIPEPVFISRVASVFVCNKSRQPKPPPDWWLEKFSTKIPQRSKPIARLDMSGKNDKESTERNHIISACDVDSYRHTNWSNYIKYCYNALVEHSMAKADANSHVEMFQEMSDLSVVYKKESSVGDILSTFVFPHQSDPDTFYFSITKGQDICCECRMKFHPL